MANTHTIPLTQWKEAMTSLKTFIKECPDFPNAIPLITDLGKKLGKIEWDLFHDDPIWKEERAAEWIKSIERRSSV